MHWGKRLVKLWKCPLAAAAVGLLVGLGIASGVWSYLRPPQDPWIYRYIHLDYDGLGSRYTTEFLPTQHRAYQAFDPELFSGDAPERRFGFDFTRDVQDRWRLVVVGDIMAHDSLQLSAFTRRDAPEETAGGYDWLLADAKPVISEADLAVGNLETVVSTSFPAQGYPTFNADPEYLKALANLGFDAMTTANNHVLDFGVEGLRDTTKNLAEHGLLFTGTSGSARHGLQIEVASQAAAESLTVGIISYTEYINGSSLDHVRDPDALAEVNYLCIHRHWTFRTFVDWFVPSTCHTSEASFYKEIAASISALRGDGADYIAVFLHRNRAYKAFPSEQERRQAVELAKLDADAIINIGAHGIKPVDRIYTRDGEVQPAPDVASREHLVVYDLGNFISTQGGASAYGLVARIDLGRDGDGRFSHAVTPFFTKSALTMEEIQSGSRRRRHEIYRLQMLDLDAFLAEIRRTL
jgi:hypothetical protein